MSRQPPPNNFYYVCGDDSSADHHPAAMRGGPIFLAALVALALGGPASGHASDDLDLPDVTAPVGKVFSLPLGSHPVYGDPRLSVKVSVPPDLPLPQWLIFSATDRLLAGIPLIGDRATLLIVVTATCLDAGDLRTKECCHDRTDVFQLTVADTPPAYPGDSQTGATHLAWPPDPGADAGADNLCDGEKVLASLVLCASLHDLDPAHRLSIARRLASFMSVPVSSVTVEPTSTQYLVAVQHGFQMVFAGPGSETSCGLSQNVEVMWSLSCPSVRHLRDFAQVLQHNVDGGRLQEELGLPLVGWYVASSNSAHTRQRRRRRGVGYNTPVPTPLLVPIRPTSVSHVMTSGNVIISSGVEAVVSADPATSHVEATRTVSSAQSSATVSPMTTPRSVDPPSPDIHSDSVPRPTSTYLTSSFGQVSVHRVSSSVVPLVNGEDSGQSSVVMTPILPSVSVDKQYFISDSAVQPSEPASGLASSRSAPPGTDVMSSPQPSPSQPSPSQSSPSQPLPSLIQIRTVEILPPSHDRSSQAPRVTADILPATLSTTVQLDQLDIVPDDQAEVTEEETAGGQVSLSPVGHVSDFVQAAADARGSIYSSPDASVSVVAETVTLVSDETRLGDDHVTRDQTTTQGSHHTTPELDTSQWTLHGATHGPDSTLDVSDVSTSTPEQLTLTFDTSTLTYDAPTPVLNVTRDLTTSEPILDSDARDGTSTIYIDDHMTRDMNTTLDTVEQTLHGQDTTVHDTMASSRNITSRAENDTTLGKISSIDLQDSGQSTTLDIRELVIPGQSTTVQIGQRSTVQTGQSTTVYTEAPMTDSLNATLVKLDSSMTDGFNTTLQIGDSMTQDQNTSLPVLDSSAQDQGTVLHRDDQQDLDTHHLITAGPSVTTQPIQTTTHDDVKSASMLPDGHVTWGNSTTTVPVHHTVTDGHIEVNTTQLPTTLDLLHRVTNGTTKLMTEGDDQTKAGSTTPPLTTEQNVTQQTVVVVSAIPGPLTTQRNATTRQMTIQPVSRRVTDSQTSAESTREAIVESGDLPDQVTAAATKSTSRGRKRTTTTAVPITTTTAPPTSTVPSTSVLYDHYSGANNRPYVKDPIKRVTGLAGQLLDYPIGPDVFTDVEDGDTRTLRLSLELQSGDELPSSYWLYLDADLQMLRGLPLKEDLILDNSSVYMVATDSGGLTERTPISLQIIDPPRKNFTHSFVMKFNVDFRKFMEHRRNITRLVNKIGSYFGDSGTEYITVLGVRQGSFILSWTNHTLAGPDCPREIIDDLYRKMDTKMNDLRAHLGTNLKLDKVTKEDLGACSLTTSRIATTTTATHFVSNTVAHGFSIWAHVVLPVVIAFLVFILIILIIIFCNRRRRHRQAIINAEKEAISNDRNPIIFPDEIDTDDAVLQAKDPLVLPTDQQASGQNSPETPSRSCDFAPDVAKSRHSRDCGDQEWVAAENHKKAEKVRRQSKDSSGGRKHSRDGGGKKQKDRMSGVSASSSLSFDRPNNHYLDEEEASSRNNTLTSNKSTSSDKRHPKQPPPYWQSQTDPPPYRLPPPYLNNTTQV